MRPDHRLQREPASASPVLPPLAGVGDGPGRAARPGASQLLPSHSHRNGAEGQNDWRRGHLTQAKILSGYHDLVVQLGGDPKRLLGSAGIALPNLESSSALLPVRAVGQLLEDTAALLGCPDFGLRLAERQGIADLMRPLDRLFCAAPCVRDALESCVRHLTAFNSGLIMGIEHELSDEMNIVEFRLLDGMALFPQFIEQLVLLTHQSIDWLSAGFVRSRKVWFSHINLAPPVAYARRFGTAVEFGKDLDGVLFRDSDMRARLPQGCPERFERETRAIEGMFTNPSSNLAIRTGQAVFHILARHERCTRQEVAEALGLQERTLNRRLSELGTTFDAIRDRVRRDLAFRYLARSDLSLTEIAGRLGYSEQAVLSRCCQRWFGTSPMRMRLRIEHITAGQSASARRART
jgi:AraC-like DNA-binding protein